MLYTGAGCEYGIGGRKTSELREIFGILELWLDMPAVPVGPCGGFAKAIGAPYLGSAKVA